MLIRWLPLVAGVLPFIGVHVCYAIAVQSGFLPACNPYVDGCTSISATGRYPPANLLFRAVELPFAALLVFTWYFSVEWLHTIRPTLGKSARFAILLSGTVGALALIVYVTFLGTQEPFYGFMRRFGIYFYFLGTVLAQLFTALSLRSGRVAVLGRLPDVLLWLCLSPFALGILNLVQKEVLPYATADALENSIEWVASILMQAYFVVLYLAWRRTDFGVQVTVGQRGQLR
jgi:hypothetical protein